MYNWMNKHLKLGLSEPVTEKPFVPATQAELSVYDAEHPRPVDSLDAVALRKRMTEASEMQMSALAQTPAEYRSVVSSALRAMVNDALPAPDEVRVGHGRGLVSFEDGTAMEKGTLCRKHGAGEVPFASLTPRQWDGTVVVWIHPQGKASLFDAGGQVLPAVQKLLNGKAAILAPDLFLTGEQITDKPPSSPAIPTKYAGYAYPGYYYGYNCGVAATRVSDILSAVAYVRGWDKARFVRLVAFEKLGPVALLAQALAGDALDRVSIDLNQFDFNQVHDATDEMMLPGILKYDGVRGMLALSRTQHAQIYNAPATSECTRCRDAGGGNHTFHANLGSSDPEPASLNLTASKS